MKAKILFSLLILAVALSGCTQEICKGGDKSCPPGCTYEKDNDCLPANECKTDTECSDADHCTTDSCSGLSKKCSNMPITQCMGNDNCCPAGCTYKNDNDCQQVDECQTNLDCDDARNCTVDLCSGTPKKCSNTPIVQCINDDNCCSMICTHETDNDCLKQDDDLINFVSDLNLGELDLSDCVDENYKRDYQGRLDYVYRKDGDIFGEVFVVKYASVEKAIERWGLENKKISGVIYDKYIIFDDELDIGRFPFCRQSYYEGTGVDRSETEYKFQAGKLFLTILVKNKSAKESIEKTNKIFSCILNKMHYSIPKESQRKLGISEMYICENAKIVENKELCVAGEICPLDYSKQLPFSQQDYCRMESAINKQDPTLCANLLNIEDWCYYYVAVVKKDDSICDKVPSLLVKGYCYQEMALLNQDITFCRKISYNYTGYPSISQERCITNLAKIKKDYSICNEIQKQENANSCYTSTAIETKDPSICDKIQQEEIKTQCYHYVAVEKNDPLICWQINSAMYREYCQIETAQELATCDKVVIPGSKDACYANVAVAQKDPSICDKIIEASIKNDCFLELAKKTQEISLCEKMDESVKGVYNKEDCYAFVAREKKDRLICEQITDEGTRYWCYMLVASVTNDIPLCDKAIKEAPNCYENIAISKQDFTLCEKANDWDDCYVSILNKYRIGYEYDAETKKFIAKPT